MFVIRSRISKLYSVGIAAVRMLSIAYDFHHPDAFECFVSQLELSIRRIVSRDFDGSSSSAKCAM